MGTKKNTAWYEYELMSIKKRKRELRFEDPKSRKRMRDDLKREQRGNKRSMKNNLKKWIDNELNGHGNDSTS
jgi:hypothetical protein